jgi:hypothetical protein
MFRPLMPFATVSMCQRDWEEVSKPTKTFAKRSRRPSIVAILMKCTEIASEPFFHAD